MSLTIFYRRKLNINSPMTPLRRFSPSCCHSKDTWTINTCSPRSTTTVAKVARNC